MVRVGLLVLLLQDGSWLKSPEEGRKEAAKSAKPTLLVALCKPGGCSVCEDFRTRVIAKPDEALKKALAGYILVDWGYDSGGKVLKWTNDHGNSMPDPAYQVWILDAKGEEFARWGNRKYVPEEFLAWLDEQARLWGESKGKKSGPARISFADVSAKSDDSGLRVEEIDKAREGEAPALIYFQIPGAGSGFGFKGRSDEIKACREFEKGPLAAASIAELSKRFTCFRIDVTKELNQKFAAKLGVETVPAIVLWAKGGKPPMVLSKKLSEKELAAAMK